MKVSPKVVHKPLWLTEQSDTKRKTSNLERTKPKIIAAIPAYNEERFIGSVVLRTKKYVDEVIVVDDGSTDATSEIARAAGAKVIRHNSNFGKGTAINTAFKEARRAKVDVLVLLDGDGQHNPSEIPVLLSPIFKNHTDIVVGSRFLNSKNSIPKYRVLGQKILTWVTNLGAKTKLTDSQSGFRAFSKKAIEAMNFQEKGLSVESEMQIIASKNNLKLKEVPINVIYAEKSKRSPLAHGFGVLNRVIAMVVERRPLFYLGIPSMVVFLLGVFTGAVVLNSFVKTGNLSIGSSLVTVLLCIIGILGVFVSLILNSLKEFIKKLEVNLLQKLEREHLSQKR